MRFKTQLRQHASVNPVSLAASRSVSSLPSILIITSLVKSQCWLAYWNAHAYPVTEFKWPICAHMLFDGSSKTVRPSCLSESSREQTGLGLEQWESAILPAVVGAQSAHRINIAKFNRAIASQDAPRVLCVDSISWQARRSRKERRGTCENPLCPDPLLCSCYPCGCKES